MPDVARCSTLYRHLFGTGNIFEYFLINHVPAIGFASHLCCFIPDSRHDSWHARLENHCPSFSLASITPLSGCEENSRRRRRRRRQHLAQDILPRLVRVTDRPETRRCAGQPLSCEQRRQDDSRAAHTSTRRSEANQIHTRSWRSVFI